MILISHRGNLHGPQPEKENTADYIRAALAAGFDVEIDVWQIDQKLFLGHDSPQITTTLEFLRTPGIWIHAKNIDALPTLLAANLHCFFHQTDPVTLTSRNYLWTYPGQPLTPTSICVLPEHPQGRLTHPCAGICSDYITKYK